MPASMAISPRMPGRGSVIVISSQGSGAGCGRWCGAGVASCRRRVGASAVVVTRGQGWNSRSGPIRSRRNMA